MKLISLNTWAGRSLYPLMKFLERHADDTDIFCLQEVLDASQEVIDERYPGEYACASLFRKISGVLPEHTGLFARIQEDAHQLSVATFVRKKVEVMAWHTFPVYLPQVPQRIGGFVVSQRLAQAVRIARPRGSCMIVNLHGLWTGGDKLDNPDRIFQSSMVRAFLASSRRKIVCGDFNLLPHTESMRILEQGMRNLVKEAGVQSTRTVLYRHYDDSAYPNFADYILASPLLEVKSFKVLPDIVSDHSPLEFEFR